MTHTTENDAAVTYYNTVPCGDQSPHETHPHGIYPDVEWCAGGRVIPPEPGADD